MASESEASNDEDTTPSSPTEYLRPMVQQALKRSKRNAKRMVTRFSIANRTTVFTAGDICTVKIPKIDRPKASAPRQLFARITERKGTHLYQVQTQWGVIDRAQAVRNLGIVPPSLWQTTNNEIGNNRREIALRTAARLACGGQLAKVRCGCRKMPCGNNCKCRKAQVKCTKYCHKVLAGQPDHCDNNAEGAAYHQQAVAPMPED